jgi:cytochrome c oxidase subunit 2
MWKTEHANGAREINALHVPVNQPVRLIMTSQDVIHSFFVPAFRMKKDVLPGRTTETWFQATKTGVFHLECAEYCGTDHSRMTGSIYVMAPADYARWIAAQPQADNLAGAGGRLFDMLGCASCHETGGKRAPVLYGLYGRHIKLTDGRTVTADEAYIRDSILQPARDVVAGYPAIMPSFKDAVSDADLARLAAYIRALKDSRGYKP